jgi:predicted component of type VI protein secretion system
VFRSPEDALFSRGQYLVEVAHSPTADAGRLRVELSLGDGPICGLDLDGESVTIGRAPRNQLSLGHPDVAKVHVRIFRGAGRLWVQPVNRIVRNDQVLDTIAEVRGGDTLRIGPYKVVVKLPNDWMELPELPPEEEVEDAVTELADIPTLVVQRPVPAPARRRSRIGAALSRLLMQRTP